MASERDFELLDDYVANRLQGPEREVFENRLQADPDLQRELKLQESIVDSLRKARAAELKSLLNNIPPSAIPSSSSNFARWTGGAVTLLIAVGLYFYLKPTDQPVSEPVTATENIVKEVPEEAAAESSPVVTDEQPSEKKTPVVTPPAKSKPDVAETTVAKPRKPDVFDPTEEEAAGEAPTIDTPGANEGTTRRSPDIVSEVVTGHKSYTFHYQFQDENKLVLYGDFDNNLYEILEFFTDNKRTVFLAYKNSFYLLNAAGDKIKPLSPVNDPVLIQKLKEYQLQK